MERSGDGKREEEILYSKIRTDSQEITQKENFNQTTYEIIPYDLGRNIEWEDPKEEDPRQWKLLPTPLTVEGGGERGVLKRPTSLILEVPQLPPKDQRRRRARRVVLGPSPINSEKLNGVIGYSCTLDSYLGSQDTLVIKLEQKECMLTKNDRRAREILAGPSPIQSEETSGEEGDAVALDAYPRSEDSRYTSLKQSFIIAWIWIALVILGQNLVRWSHL